MREQLKFDMSMLKDRLYVVATVGVLEVIYIMLGLVYANMSVEGIAVVSMGINSVITYLVLQAVSISGNRKGQYCINLSKLVYFPTKKKYYIYSKYIISFMIMIVQVVLSLITVSLSKLTSPGLAGYNIRSMFLFFVVLSVCMGSILSVIVVSAFHMFQTAYVLILSLYVGALTGLSFGMGDCASRFTSSMLLIGIIIILAIWILSIPIARIITKYVS